jgi:hypothetical protein
MDLTDSAPTDPDKAEVDRLAAATTRLTLITAAFKDRAGKAKIRKLSLFGYIR